jgi:hypothetical protein
LRGPRVAAIAIVAVCALALIAVQAGAMTGIQLQPGGAITKRVENFTARFFGGEVTVICRLTLRGRLAQNISKASAGLLPEGRIGRIENAATAGCMTNFGGAAEMTILVEPGTPFNLRYDAFLGALPNITGIRFTKLGFSIKIFEPVVLESCLYRGQVSLLMSFPPVEGPAGGRFNPESFVTPNALPLFAAGEGNCPATVELSGAGGIGPAQFAILTD